ncbi:T9SS type B sorting domain-containing protein [Algoriella sp.]|uniref:T9SS type B sorting domain-containing protein n=1 Tax=Algoriella sp. TaxID=1872434 RepID=UPI001B193754|nr:T9SS type B sorting domain-containing protein [Algoriella sp.]MBO6212034.1 T9SS type B sorting domain-containing protein [Algoriella sp.]
MIYNDQKYQCNKLFLIGLLLLSGSSLLGQQSLCLGSTHQYSVDLDENSGNGTIGSTYTWKVVENTFVGNIISDISSGNKITINWENTPTGIYTLQVTETNSCGTSTEEMTVTIAQNLKVDLEPIHYFCPDFNQMSIKAPSGYNDYKWFDENNVLVGEDEVLVVNTPGKYRLEVKSGECTASAETDVVLVEFPTFMISTDLDNSIIIVNSVGNIDVYYQLESENGKIIFPWQDSNTFRNVASGKYIVRAKSKNGSCLTSFEAEAMIIPNVITPNNDGINDLWDLNKFLKDYPNSVVEIFDRFGKKVKTISQADNFKWDGKIAGKPVPTDNYWYVIKLNDKQTKSGSILIKNK